jgi:WD40 repeat protein
MQPLIGHTKAVRAVAFVPDGRLVSGGEDKRVIIWDPRQAVALETIKAKLIVYGIAVAPDGERIVFGGRPAAVVKSWDLSQNQPGAEYLWPPMIQTLGDLAAAAPQMPPIPVGSLGSIWSLSYSADGNTLAAASRVSITAGNFDGSVARFWSTNNPTHETRLTDGKVYSVAFAPTGTTIALAREGNVGLFDRPNGNELWSYKIQCSWAAAIAFVPGAHTVVIAASSYLHFVDVKGVAKPRKVKTGFRTITSIAISPDGSRVLVGGWPKTLELYDVPTGALQTTLDFEVETVYAVAFSPDGCTFAVGSDKGLMICDVP